MSRLLRDEFLRLRFALYPLETLAELHLQGYPLTPTEIDIFLQADITTWLITDRDVGRAAH